MNDPSSYLIRRAALQKLVLLSATAPTASTASDLKRLQKSCGLVEERANGSTSETSVSKVPMRVQELDVLLSLCNAAPFLRKKEQAERLLLQLSPYFLDCQAQAISPSPFLRDIEPSPWEALAFRLTSALLSIGAGHESLRDLVHARIQSFLEKCTDLAESLVSEKNSADADSAADGSQALEIVILAVSILGFLDAAAANASFWLTEERIDLIEAFRAILSGKFMVSLERALSIIRTSHSAVPGVRDWRRNLRHYAAIGRPLGAMILQWSFMRFTMSHASLAVAEPRVLRTSNVLDILLSDKGFSLKDQALISKNKATLLADIALDEMQLLEDNSDYLQLGSAWQQRLACAVKSSALTNLTICLVLDSESVELETLLGWLENTMADPIQMANETLASVVLKCLTILAKRFPLVTASATRSLPRFLVQGAATEETVTVAAACLASILQLVSHDSVITTLYSLGNVLSSSRNADLNLNKPAMVNGVSRTNLDMPYTQQAAGSSISLTSHTDDDVIAVYGNVVHAIVEIANSCKDDKITALAQSMLIQKIGKVDSTVDARIITEAARLAVSCGALEFRSFLKLISKLSHDSIVQGNLPISNAILNARSYLSTTIEVESQFFEPYLRDLLDEIVSKGDVHTGSSRHGDAELAAREISQLLQPLSLLVSTYPTYKESVGAEVLGLFREAWFNIVVHGFNLTSNLGKEFFKNLQAIAAHTGPLVAQERADQLDSDIELNTVLRRGMDIRRTTEQRRDLAALLPSREADIKNLTYPELIFLRSAHLVETLRANSGSCSQLLMYFLDPALKSGPMGACMAAIVEDVLGIYLSKALAGNRQELAAPFIAKQLADFLVGCCHRMEKVQQVALSCVDRIIHEAPSALCQRSSLFSLLELLSIMWYSCLDAETEEYEWRSHFSSAKGNVAVELSDNYSLRRSTLNHLYKRAKSWVMRVINIAPLDVKGLLQSYLSEYDDDGAYGHISLGRSFAAEMGSALPTADQRLGAIDRDGEDWNINTASDFISQYTSRQEYRYAEPLQGHDAEWLKFIQRDRQGGIVSHHGHGKGLEDAVSLLAGIQTRITDGKFVSIGELRDALRRAAAVLCNTKDDQSAVVHYLVNIPFLLFSKQSIKLGISIWMGVINENARMEPRILTEIASCWEASVRKKQGFFNDRFHHLDPFYIKEEFAPSDREATSKRQQAAHNIIAPHFRVLQFLASHFNANRLGSPQIRRIFHRIVRVTLNGIVHATNHPLAREMHFQIILFALGILRHTNGLDAAEQWRLKDQILCAALRWFSHPSSWSFGGNRLQIKAETHLLADVEAALRNVVHLPSGTSLSLKSLQSKQELLEILLDNEQTRLIVWLFPLDHERRHYFSSRNPAKAPAENTITPLLKTAWSESTALVLQLVNRFSFPKLTNNARWLLLNFPERALDEADALQLLLGSSLPTDVSFQLKYLLYWAPVNPIAAVTYFLPAYANHPYVLQYAMRALESHSVDVTFFYVPQIVQTLRYDILGYVERYILETAKFSQLFAHQIIWNMMANAYKDEDSQIPDPLKPTLDTVMEKLIASFSGDDKDFYEREFSFFNEVTDISGKLRPYIKRPKPEKKQKIEEELRKIKVEVGVYLPSNPDGAVVGIDRKSGKPLQSHAKAPFMATFRIRKNKSHLETADVLIEDGKHNRPSEQDTFEIWQSAIFKVGDDCRQDILALQMIATFRGIFNSVGLDVFVFPYRVTATAPGCGVIDVLPNSISRDMLGREAVNGLYDYFVSKYGGPDSIRFQEARKNFVKSMAAYSVISYLLQFKDRHNGNIMVDDAGHILHIDFGFCFDIAPGGIRFERAPFKLTSEMVAVMGGSTESQAYRWFEELCIKAFLASRPFTDKLAHLVILMLDSGLPCFKPETIQHFKERFVVEKSEREAAEFMRDLIKKSYSSYSTRGYDQFQLLTNGIPY
ncbi:phosphatidylinositol 4-kinase [Xylona heveae TC161]|uniref:1-phosphatidylinositol 4-kinase n=1 Tax=Xylona heveae (strain CBS 132557 / TC161) TaxID=1328760 RepID=A0A165K1V5_XYLHT|nr:phosphatidylinositol 4-kinase [Xylona heveae TC161]KZF26893.1 phosphatidylinositol 4-kinase [Xylona heveae TC161]